jgi:putative DNA primase/helicase
MQTNHLLAKLEKHLPGGRVDRHDYVMLNPTRPDKNLGSFRINLQNGLWADFALDDPKARGKGIISLFAYVRDISYKRAAQELGVPSEHKPKTKRRPTVT